MKFTILTSTCALSLFLAGSHGFAMDRPDGGEDTENTSASSPVIQPSTDPMDLDAEETTTPVLPTPSPSLTDEEGPSLALFEASLRIPNFMTDLEQAKAEKDPVKLLQLAEQLRQEAAKHALPQTRQETPASSAPEEQGKATDWFWAKWNTWFVKVSPPQTGEEAKITITLDTLTGEKVTTATPPVATAPEEEKPAETIFGDASVAPASSSSWREYIDPRRWSIWGPTPAEDIRVTFDGKEFKVDDGSIINDGSVIYTPTSPGDTLIIPTTSETDTPLSTETEEKS